MNKIMGMQYESQMERLSSEDINELCKEREIAINILKQRGIPKSGMIYYNGIRFIINNGVIR